MSRRNYRLIVLLTLPLPFLATYALGSRLAEWLADFEIKMPLAGLLSLLGYLLVLLGCIVVWGAALWPLRLRAGFAPLSEELQKVKEAGGLANAVAQERTALEARATSDDPNERRSYHLAFGLVSALFSVAGAGVCWALWNDGYVLAFAVAMLLVCPILTLYHGIQWLRVSG